MTNQTLFNQAKEKHLKMLEQYVPVVSRVHGGNHPEFYEVNKEFDEIDAKIKEAGSSIPELNEEFTKLRKITADYSVPGDVCETYETVYNMLAELDKAYHA
jgi:regulator of cell morphogenesis and NO signaling